MEENKVLMLTGATTYQIVQPPVSIRISSPITGEHLGDFKEKDGVLTFEGKVDEAGQVFVDFICKSFDARIKQLIESK